MKKQRVASQRKTRYVKKALSIKYLSYTKDASRRTMMGQTRKKTIPNQTTIKSFFDNSVIFPTGDDELSTAYMIIILKQSRYPD